MLIERISSITMNKKTLAEQLARRTNMPQKDAGETIDHLVEIITSSIQSGIPVTLRGFGTFTMRERGARMVHDRKSGDSRRINSAMLPHFKPSRGLRQSLKT